MQAPTPIPGKKTGLWRRTPPAIFPPILGLFGLAIAWRRATDVFGMPAAIADLLTGAVIVLYVFAVVAYAAKILRRPGALTDDLKVLPGRAGLAAMSMSGMLLAMGLIQYSEILAQLVLVVAVATHLLFLALIVKTLLTGPVEARVVTPVFHLTFVGLIVSPLAALPLGATGFSTVVFWVSMVAAILIWGASLAQLIKKDVPPPLRPLLAIHLAPASLLGTVAMLLGNATLGLVFGALAIVILAVLLLRARWVVAAGFSPLWGAFTFPIAAFTSLMLVMSGAGFGIGFRVLGGLGLVAATLFIPWVAYKVLQLWGKGGLAAKTNASEA